MRYYFTITLFLLVISGLRAQGGKDSDAHTSDTTKLANTHSLNEVVVTGQSEPQSLRNSVYQVRTIDSERIRLRGATNLQTILNTELGIRFSNDLTLGTSDIQLMGITGRGIKILLDGIPLTDRGDSRESLGQVDINTIEKIEIVEGPMSVIYGTDALAGVINIISKKAQNGSVITVNARLQEETAGDEYNALTKKGTHNQGLGLTWQNAHLQLSGNVTRNNFGGWQGASTGRAKAWKPKDQMLYTAGTRFTGKQWNVWYRFNGTDETITSLGNLNLLNEAGDQEYISKRWFHQVQSEWKVNERLALTAVGSYTDYSRRTLSTKIDSTGRRTLSLEPGSQDKSIFTTTFFRGTAFYKVGDYLSILGGVDFSNNDASGARIKGTPAINEYALFIAPEIRFGQFFKLTPGLRFLKNSVYDAPPVIPSLNGKLTLSKSLDFRFGYARGFRSPALRELYFDFHDASHSINGNVNLKAEYSNSFNSFLVWQAVSREGLRVSSTLGGFYNVFHDLIDTGFDPNDRTQTTYLNIHLFKTTGISLDNKIFWKNLQATLGATYIGRYNEFSESPEDFGQLPKFVWSTEVNANLLYTFKKVGATINLFYKFSGKRPVYEISDLANIHLAETQGFHMADLTFSKTLGKYVNLLGGAKNLFDVTNLRNTSTDTGGAHSTGGAVPQSFGRSYFLGLNFQWTKH
ncbi:outer membrane receptor for ferrienterochelin and colicins [Dyadobacter sp. SG02]|uniref:TonB-dependent receptor plug domain-containing protein n=1 Tax=Dyadobacter sp. SG02 TaxID=1855291 RepID=UPI0008C7E011|nr:TonB-dependent receptor [Dyadobacter sp. SG02]SEJ77053.1 outer membrane receptor for ferrienterochelin and colicins [Dyadobacter sp. SG02]